jgi:hypothetical protein
VRRFRYTVLSSGLSQLWFPAALWALFAAVALVVRDPVRLSSATRAYLGFALPLSSGGLAGYAILEDRALELRFSAPIPAWRTLAERLVPALAVTAVCAGAAQTLMAAMGVHLAVLGGWLGAQLVWLVPCLTLMAAGHVGALAGRRASSGALAAGLIWLVELIAHSSFLDSVWGRHLLIFLGAMVPDDPALRANQLTLLMLCAVLFTAAVILLRRQERYL